MSSSVYTFADLESFIEKPLGTTAWLTLAQSRVNDFAACTDDRQWIHVDPERAYRDSPLRSTIAHGLLSLSLLPRFSYEVGLMPPDATHALNYGFDKVRFLAPVVVGSRVRDVVTLISVQRKSPGQALVNVQHTVEIEGSDKPALVAEALIMIFASVPGAATGTPGSAS